MIRMMIRKTKAARKSEIREVKEKGYKSSSNPSEQSNRETREGEETRLAQKRLLISVDDANSSPQKSLEPSSFSSKQSSKQRPLKPAPEGIYFKKRKREFERKEIENSDDGKEKFVLMQSAAKSELDEMFPESKLKLNYSSRSPVSKKKYKIVEETLEDIFGR